MQTALVVLRIEEGDVVAIFIWQRRSAEVEACYEVIGFLMNIVISLARRVMS
jgi:hypothetical protein